MFAFATAAQMWPSLVMATPPQPQMPPPPGSPVAVLTDVQEWSTSPVFVETASTRPVYGRRSQYEAMPK